METPARARRGAAGALDTAVDHLRHHDDTVPPAAAAGRRRALAQAGEGGAGAGGGTELRCDGFVRAVWPECGNVEGYAPVVTSETVEQVRGGPGLVWFGVVCFRLGRSCWGSGL